MFGTAVVVPWPGFDRRPDRRRLDVGILADDGDRPGTGELGLLIADVFAALDDLDPGRPEVVGVRVLEPVRRLDEVAERGVAVRQRRDVDLAEVDDAVGLLPSPYPSR